MRLIKCNAHLYLTKKFLLHKYLLKISIFRKIIGQIKSRAYYFTKKKLLNFGSRYLFLGISNTNVCCVLVPRNRTYFFLSFMLHNNLNTEQKKRKDIIKPKQTTQREKAIKRKDNVVAAVLLHLSVHIFTIICTLSSRWGRGCGGWQKARCYTICILDARTFRMNE